jgi:hypothetical protein
LARRSERLILGVIQRIEVRRLTDPNRTEKLPTRENPAANPWGESFELSIRIFSG